MPRYGMAIDTTRCIGCKSCLMACKVANNLPKDVWYNHLVTQGTDVEFSAEGTYPDLKMVTYTVACQHCENAPCVEVCPTGASYRTAEGVVRIDSEKCIGCKACIGACPYDVRTLLEEPVYYLDVTVGDGFAPNHIAGTVEKCDFCYDRIQSGGIPACMDLCPGRARVWGDLDDPESEISLLLERRETMRLLEEEGTQPSVFYLL